MTKEELVGLLVTMFHGGFRFYDTPAPIAAGRRLLGWVNGSPTRMVALIQLAYKVGRWHAEKRAYDRIVERIHDERRAVRGALTGEKFMPELVEAILGDEPYADD